MKKKHIFLAMLTLTTAGVFCSCDNEGDDLRGIGARVERLEADLPAITDRLEAIQRLVTAMQTHGYITRLQENSDGTTTIYFNSESNLEPITLENGVVGADGAGANGESPLGVQKDPLDGIYYWVFAGDWLRDENGNRLRAQPMDGKDGKNGEDGKNGADGKNGEDGKDGKDSTTPTSDFVLPQVRINEDNRTWEISLDGGLTWTNTGVSADGKDGKDGRDGRDGRDGDDGEDGKNGKNGDDGKNDPTVKSVVETEDSVIIEVCVEGVYRVITIPKMK